MRVSVIGTGYVGLVPAACGADFGHDVVCAHRDATRIDQLRRGRSPIYEAGLDAILEGNLASQRPGFSTNPAIAVEKADAVLLAVDTLARGGGGLHCETLELRPLRWLGAADRRQGRRRAIELAGAVPAPIDI